MSFGLSPSLKRSKMLIIMEVFWEFAKVKPLYLKTHRLENSPFLVWVKVKWKRRLLKPMQKKAPHTVISIGAFQSFSVDDMRERKCFGMKTNKCGQVKTKTKTWQKIFCFVSLEQQGYLKNALVASGPQIYTNLRFSLQMGFWSCPLGVSDSRYVDKSHDVFIANIKYSFIRYDMI